MTDSHVFWRCDRRTPHASLALRVHLDIVVETMPASEKRNPWDLVAYVLSVWFGCGLVPRAPGTAGTLGALPLYLLLRMQGVAAVVAGAVVVTVVGIWASDRTARRLGQKDPQIVCIDEVAGVLFTWAAVPDSVVGVVVGFVLFRIADQLKPWPARAAERRLPGGFGIVLDDVFAAGWAIVVVLVARRVGWLR